MILAAMTAAWAGALAACFCSFQSMASPAAKMPGKLRSSKVGLTLIWPRSVRASEASERMNSVLGRPPDVGT